MKFVQIGKDVVKFYDSAESLPIKRFQKFNKYLMIDNEVGSTFDDYMKRNQRVMELMSKEMYKEATTEMQNTVQTVFNAFNDYSPKEYALAITVHSINEKIYTDYSAGGLDEILNRLNEIGFTKEAMDQEVSDVKKK